MTTNEFNSVLDFCFSPTSEYNKSRKIGSFTFSLFEEKIIFVEGKFSYSFLVEVLEKIPSLKYDLEDFSSPELEIALREFNFIIQFSSLDHKSYSKKYDIYFKEVLGRLISTGNTLNLIIKKLSINGDQVEFLNFISCLKSYYSE